MKSWILPTLLTLIFWGVWGFFPKLTVQYISPKSAIIFEILGAMLVAFSILCLLRFKLDVHPKGIALAISTGVFGLAGALCFLTAVSRGKLSSVVTVTALYPVVTLTLAFMILKEPVTIREVLGMVLALAAIVLVTTSQG